MNRPTIIKKIKLKVCGRRVTVSVCVMPGIWPRLRIFDTTECVVFAYTWTHRVLFWNIARRVCKHLKIFILSICVDCYYVVGRTVGTPLPTHFTFHSLPCARSRKLSTCKHNPLTALKSHVWLVCCLRWFTDIFVRKATNTKKNKRKTTINEWMAATG